MMTLTPQQPTTKKQYMKHELRTLNETLKSMMTKLDCDRASQRFRMKPDRFSPKITVKPYCGATTTVTFTCQMIQLPANLNDATTGHKLQGTTKDVIIITSWPRGNLFKNWEYVILSRVCTLNALYLLQPIDMNKSSKPAKQLECFICLWPSVKKQIYRGR